MQRLIARVVLTIVALAACHGTSWAQASNVIFPTNYPYTQTNLRSMDVISSSNGVLQARVEMISAGTTNNPIRYGDGYAYTGIGSSNNGNAGMYGMAYKFAPYGSTNSTNSAGFPGTMLQIQPGDKLKLEVVNKLAGTNSDPSQTVFISNFHYHGSHAPDLSWGDNVYVQFTNNSTNTFSLPIEQYENSVGLNWYHPHKHHVSKDQVQGGMAGLIMVGDPLTPWPQYKGRFKQVNMAFSEVNLQTNANGKFQFFELATGDKYGTNYTEGWQKMVNGQMNPIITIAPGETQIWNMCMASARGGIAPVIADANLSNAWSNCTILARDGNSAFVHPYKGTLSSSTVRMQDITSWAAMTTGGRTTWAITAPTNAGTYYLMDGWGGEETPNNASGTNYFYVLATIKVTGTPATTGVPTFAKQDPDPLWSAIPDVYRTFGLEQQGFSYYDSRYGTNIDQFFIDGKQFGEGVLPQMEIGSVEEWTINNGGPLNHPFHIHQGNFIVTQVGGVMINPNLPPQPDFLGRNYVSPLDVVWVPAYTAVTIRMRVQNFPGKYVWHCHILEHEDEGMMSPVFQYGGREGIRLGLGASLPSAPVINGKGNVTNTITPFPRYVGPIVTASGTGTDTNAPQLPTRLPYTPSQANALYKTLTVKQTLAVGTGTRRAEVRIYANGSNAPTASIPAAFSGRLGASGVSLAVGGVSSNGAVTIAVGSRARGPATVSLFNQGGTLVRTYTNIFGDNKTCPTGVNVAIGDVNADNFDDIVVSAGAGREAIITALSGKDISYGATNPSKCFTVVAGDPSSKEGARVAVGYVAPATVPSYVPNLMTTPEQGPDVGTVSVWNTYDLSGSSSGSSMGGMSTNSSNNGDVMPIAEYRPFGRRAGAVNIATTYQTLPSGKSQPVIAAWQKPYEAAFTGIGLDNVPWTQLRQWSARK
jgi:FtsP/CotA-like multicopper oxidase with cupredoxin domain